MHPIGPCTVKSTTVGPAQFLLLEGILIRRQIPGTGSRHDFKTEIEMDQHRFELFINVAVSGKLGLTR